MLWSGIEWDTGMSDLNTWNTWKQQSKSEKEPDRHYILHDIIVCSLNDIALPLIGWLCVYILVLSLLLVGWNFAAAWVPIKFLLIDVTSGNRTPGSRFYSDLLDTFVCIHQLVLKRRSKALGCSCNCRRLAYGSLINAMSHDDHAVQLIEPWRPKRRQNIITALTTLPQGWVSTRKHQYTIAI